LITQLFDASLTKSYIASQLFTQRLGLLQVLTHLLDALHKLPLAILQAHHRIAYNSDLIRLLGRVPGLQEEGATLDVDGHPNSRE
jgi:hypothetical protein